MLVTGGRDLYSTVDTTLIGANFCLTRYDTLGNLDSTFQHRQCQFGIAQRIVAHQDGKFLVSGVMDVFDSQPVGHIFKVNYDGSLDSTFHTNIDFGTATDYYFYNDGRILASGWFHSPEIPNDTIPLVRLMPDGTIDHSFNYDIRLRKYPGSSSVGVVQGMYTLDSATLFIGGSFATLNEEWVGGVFAIDTAGTILPEYFPGMNCDTIVGPNTIIALGMRDFEMGPDGMLYAYGFFHGFDDGYQNHPDQTMIIRLKQVNVGVEELSDPRSDATLSLFPNPATSTVTIDYTMHESTAEAYLVVSDLLGRELFRHQVNEKKQHYVWDTQAVASGTYNVTLVNKTHTLRTEKLVIHH
ncbi:MAG: T9SS type A sorting domain-containing protein [Flavobacteriales bacterium]|nr:T9SS type A sorting domain-containing protein [Flavobacteriales bacterium]